jgi:hypothetical protein
MNVPQSAASDPLQQSFAGLMLYYARGDVIDMHATLRTLPVKMISVAEFAQSTA